MRKSIEQRTKEQEELFAELKKLAKRANQRLVRLERRFGLDTWGIVNLRNRLNTEKLDAWTKTGRVRYNKSMTIKQMQYTINIVNKFLSSETSTATGIKKIKKRQIEGLRKSLGREDIDLSYEEAEALYRAFEDTDYNFFVPQYFTASEFFSLIREATDQKWSLGKFRNEILNYSDDIKNDISDEELKIRIEAIYKKYV